jgi:hypothetical protein
MTGSGEPGEEDPHGSARDKFRDELRNDLGQYYLLVADSRKAKASSITRRCLSIYRYF